MDTWQDKLSIPINTQIWKTVMFKLMLKAHARHYQSNFSHTHRACEIHAWREPSQMKNMSIH